MKKVAKKEEVLTPNLKRYLGALNEMHGQNLKTIMEGRVITDRKLDNLTKLVENHTEMIGSIMEDVSILKEDVSVLKEDVSELKSDMKVVKEDISVMKSDLKKKVDYDEFLSLVRRVQNLESKK